MAELPVLGEGRLTDRATAETGTEAGVGGLSLSLSLSRTDGGTEGRRVPPAPATREPQTRHSDRSGLMINTT